MNQGNVENILARQMGGAPDSSGNMERMYSEPQEPGFFSASNSNERMSYNLWQEMRSEVMKRNLLYELDRANNPMSLGDVSRVTGQPSDALATEAQRSVPIMGEQTERYKEEGPQPRGMVPIGKETVDTVRPLHPIMTPRQLLGDDIIPGATDVAWDQYDRRSPAFWQPGQEEAITRDILAPGVIQGPGAPVEKERTVQTITGFKPNESADASTFQRQMAEAKIHQMGLRPILGGAGRGPSTVQQKLDMLIEAGMDPAEARLLIGGATNQERLERQTTGNLDLMGAKRGNLEEQTRASKEMFSTKKNLYGQQAALAKARTEDITDMSPLKREHLSQTTKTSSALEQYYKARMDGRDVELALRESKLLQAASEQDRKWILAQLSYAKANKDNMTDEQFDGLVDAIGQNLLIKGDVTKAPLMDRVMGLFGEQEEKVPVEAGLPSSTMPAPGTGATGSARAKMSNVPSKDAGDVLKQMTEELGDLTRLEGKTITDQKTKKRYTVKGGKLQEAK